MLELGALSAMRVFFATPAYAMGTTSLYSKLMFELASQLGRLGMDCRLELGSHSSVTHGRNRLVAQFLSEAGWTHLFWVDGDIGAKPEAVFRLLLADRDVVAGVYPLKRYIWPGAGLPQGMTKAQFEDTCTPYPFNPLDGRLKSDEHGFGEVVEATTGFMCIKREVLIRMMAAYPDLKVEPDDNPAPELIPFSYGFFDNMIDPESRRPLTEDYAFCRRWRKIGGKVFIDIHSKLDHMGNHVWRGDLHAGLMAGGARRS